MRPIGLLCFAMASAGVPTYAEEPAEIPAALDRAAKEAAVQVVNVRTDLDVETPFGPITAKPTGSGLTKYARLLSEEFALYPASLVRKARLRRLVLCSDLAFNGELRGAIPDYWHGDLYLDVVRGSASPPYQRTAIHHEFFHLVDYQDDGEVYRDDAWSALNPIDFRYGPGGANVQDDPSGSLPNEKTRGFLTAYATSGVEEDKAEVFSRLIMIPREVERRSSADPIIWRKVARMKDMLKAFEPSVDEVFWKRIAERPDTPIGPVRSPAAPPPHPEAHFESMLGNGKSVEGTWDRSMISLIRATISG
ncbi:zinc-binding metallopeptidase [Paludisphaera rhizosphaerae]|uniref:hypothetical protein n=1 Tax=Paludisphaera rhizosphaerae TaxID=2711216 RepID=UPI0013EA1319|nr:hypothetical protein [Paludisphaera rhizosphaerae]